MTDDSGYYSSTGQFVEAPKRQLFRLQVPYMLRFAIVWTAFFIIAGVAIQYFQATDPVFMTVFNDFFLKEYAAWFRSFGSFADVTVYPTASDFIYSLLGHWYYFFYTGGLLSLIWGILSWIINWEFVVKKPEFRQPPQPPQPPTQVREIVQPVIVDQRPIIIERSVVVEKQVPAKEESKPAYNPQPQTMYSRPLLNLKIHEWLEAGLLLLSEGNVEEAEMIYDQISREYDPGQDMDQDTYKRILDFYYEISAKKKQMR